jgi:glutaredoxin
MKSAPFLLLMFMAAPAWAGVYKWTDAQGRIQYSDVPPTAAKSTTIKLQSYSGPVQVSRGFEGGSGVTLYTTEWCGVCKRAKAFLKQNNIPFSEWDVEKSDYGAGKFRQLGGKGVPLITVGAQKMLGFDASRLLELWQSGQSKP